MEGWWRSIIIIIIRMFIIRLKLRPRIVRDGRIVGRQPGRQSGSWKLEFLLEFWMEVELKNMKVKVGGFGFSFSWTWAELRLKLKMGGFGISTWVLDGSGIEKHESENGRIWNFYILEFLMKVELVDMKVKVRGFGFTFISLEWRWRIWKWEWRENFIFLSGQFLICSKYLAVVLLNQRESFQMIDKSHEYSCNTIFMSVANNLEWFSLILRLTCLIIRPWRVVVFQLRVG